MEILYLIPNSVSALMEARISGSARQCRRCRVSHLTALAMAAINTSLLFRKYVDNPMERDSLLTRRLSFIFRIG